MRLPSLRFRNGPVVYRPGRSCHHGVGSRTTEDTEGTENAEEAEEDQEETGAGDVMERNRCPPFSPCPPCPPWLYLPLPRGRHPHHRRLPRRRRRADPAVVAGAV